MKYSVTICITSIPCIVATIVMATLFFKSENEHMQQLEELELSKYCMSCCIGMQQCVNDDICKIRLNSEYCASSSGDTGSIPDRKNVQQLAQTMLSKREDRDIGGEFEDPDAVRERLDFLTDVVISSPKPKAHLSGAFNISATQPIPTGARNEYKNTYWEWRYAVRFSNVLHGMEYNSESGALQINDQGRYVIYLHTTFYTASQPDMEIRENCHLSHAVKLENLIDVNPLNTLMSTHETRNCNVKTRGSVNRNGRTYTNMGFHTFHSVGVYQLRKGDQLTVHYEMPSYVRVASLDRETYFGAFMI